MLMTAPSGQGKSAILNAFYSQHKPDPNPDGEEFKAPVILLQSPPKPLEGRMVYRLLETLNAPFKPSASPEAKLSQLTHLLRICGVKVIIIDEIHFALACTDRQQRGLGNVLRYIANELRIAIIAVGTEEAELFVKSQTNLVTRFRQVRLPVWCNNDAFGAFLEKYEKTLPLRKESKLGQESVRTKIYQLSSGSTVAIVNLLHRAAELAIKVKEERITPALLETVA
jgi:hypothetical protein